MADQYGVAPREMRLIELEDGWATAVELDNSVVGWGLSAAALGMMVGMGALVVTDNPLTMVIAGIGLLGVMLFPQRSYTRFRLRPHGLEVGKLYTRGAPTIDQVRAGDGGSMIVPRREGTRELPFSEIRALGYTDYSVWFDVAGERVEVVLERTSRADIQRLHDEIHAVWERYRAGLSDTEDEAARRREQLKQVVARKQTEG